VIIAEIKTKHGEYELRIDGITYSLLAPGELSLRDHYLIGEAGVRLLYLQKEINTDTPDDASETQREELEEKIARAMAELDRCLRTCTSSILSRIPGDVRAKITQTQLMSIMTAYQMAIRQENEARSGGEAAGARPFMEAGPRP